MPMYKFSVDYNIIDNSNIIYIYKYLMEIFNGNIIKNMFIGLLTSAVNASNQTKYVSLNNQ